MPYANKVLISLLCMAFCLPVMGDKMQSLICKKNPMYCEILRFNPKMKKKKAMLLSNYLVYYGKKWGHDPWLSLAIAKQESSLKKNKRKQLILLPNRRCNKKRCRTRYVLRRGVSDIGLFQLHASTILHYRFNATRLLYDLRYMVTTHYKVLNDKKKQCQHLGQQAWSCYHSNDPILRKRYAKRVKALDRRPNTNN